MSSFESVEAEWMACPEDDCAIYQEEQNTLWTLYNRKCNEYKIAQELIGELRLLLDKNGVLHDL